MDANQIYFLLGIVLSIPIGIGVNLAAPRIQEWLTNRPKVSAAKKIQALQDELAKVSGLYSKRDQLLYETLSNTFLVLLYLSIGNAAWVAPAVLTIDFIQLAFAGIAFFFFLNAILVCLNFIRLISKIRNFEKYKSDVEARIERIEAQGIAPRQSDPLIQTALIELERKPTYMPVDQRTNLPSVINVRDIPEWKQPIPGFKPVPFGPSLVTNVHYPDIAVPFKRPLFGVENIPFELALAEPQHFISGIQYGPSFPTDLVRSPEIRPGAKEAISAYALITSGNAYRISDNVEFDGMIIGYLEFYFEDGELFRLELVLGKNIREWVYSRPEVVKTLSDQSSKQVWHDPENNHTVDMVGVDFPKAPRNVSYCQICAQLESVPGYYKKALPVIRLSGLTYRLNTST